MRNLVGQTEIPGGVLTRPNAICQKPACVVKRKFPAESRRDPVRVENRDELKSPLARAFEANAIFTNALTAQLHLHIR